MNGFVYSTKPDDATLKAWFQGLEPKAQAFLFKHYFQVPFWFYGWPGKFAEACMANDEVHENCRLYPDVHKLDGYQKHPVIRWEWDMVVVIGGMEVLNWSLKKTWGKLNWVAPLRPEDPVNPMFLECIHNPQTSIWHQRLLQKQWLKAKLGRGGAGLVHRARKDTKENFVGTLTTGISCGVVSESAPMASQQIANAKKVKLVKTRADGVKVFKCYWHGEPEKDTALLIRRKLGMTPDEFWHAAKCHTMLTERQMEPQGSLFQ